MCLSLSWLGCNCPGYLPCEIWYHVHICMLGVLLMSPLTISPDKLTFKPICHVIYSVVVKTLSSYVTHSLKDPVI